MEAEDPVRVALVQAAREFNAGRYFEAHEAIEEALDDTPDEIWDLLLGLIQISVGYHKLTQGLHEGAQRMLGLGLEKIEGFAEDAADLNLGELRERARSERESLGRGRFDPVAFHRSPPRLKPPRARKRAPS